MQRGFRPSDGVSTNVIFLQAIIRERTGPAKLCLLSVCYEDIKKAFDPVGHYSILLI